ncbi:hypothetical protein SCFA_610007 [anaerobic digester metagenome]|uniref:Uncharacterized protein n=1 Tax=anaerobic digester metagenome TaxID=1263854 RepID=A0A485M4F8_9ZZZZ
MRCIQINASGRNIIIEGEYAWSVSLRMQFRYRCTQIFNAFSNNEDIDHHPGYVNECPSPGVSSCTYPPEAFRD